MQSKNVLAFLRVIRAGESSQGPQAYTTLFGGDEFGGFAAHPNIKVTRGKYTSTAAGAYQFLYRTWRGLVAQYGFPDFSPQYQDLGAIALLKGRNALDDVVAGRLTVASTQSPAEEWASLPRKPIRAADDERRSGTQDVRRSDGGAEVPHETKRANDERSTDLVIHPGERG